MGAKRCKKEKWMSELFEGAKEVLRQKKLKKWLKAEFKMAPENLFWAFFRAEISENGVF